jgi:hypothetical protein
MNCNKVVKLLDMKKGHSTAVHIWVVMGEKTSFVAAGFV